MRYLKDLILTDTHLLKGHVVTGGQRLSTFLNTTPRRHVEMYDVTLCSHSPAETVTMPRVLVRVPEILLAHEMDEAGDQALKILAERERDEVPIAAFFGGAAPIRIGGRASRRVIEREAASSRDFIVIVDPMIEGIPGGASPDYAVLSSLPYVIANRSRMALICGQ
jgi:hypothetical protein